MTKERNYISRYYILRDETLARRNSYRFVLEKNIIYLSQSGLEDRFLQTCPRCFIEKEFKESWLFYHIDPKVRSSIEFNETSTRGRCRKEFFLIVFNNLQKKKKKLTTVKAEASSFTKCHQADLFLLWNYIGCQIIDSPQKYEFLSSDSFGEKFVALTRFLSLSLSLSLRDDARNPV